MPSARSAAAAPGSVPALPAAASDINVDYRVGVDPGALGNDAPIAWTASASPNTLLESTAGSWLLLSANGSDVFAADQATGAGGAL